MNAASFIASLLTYESNDLGVALSGLSPAQLHFIPAPGANTIAWLAWHLTRTQDNAVSAWDGMQQTWIADRWYEKFGRRRDPLDRGSGHTTEEAAAFRTPDVATLLGYNRAVLGRIAGYLAPLTDHDLDKQVPNVVSVGLQPARSPDPVPLSTRLLSIVNDVTQHMGQINYVRGVMHGGRWMPL